MNNILVISPHPDDETLGCGGTLLRHNSEGDHIFWLNITSINENEGWPLNKIKQRDTEIEKVSKERRARDCNFCKLALENAVRKTKSPKNQQQSKRCCLP